MGDKIPLVLSPPPTPLLGVVLTSHGVFWF